MANFAKLHNHLHQIFCASMTAWEVLEVRDDQARVRSAPDVVLLSQYLSQFDPKWEIMWFLEAHQPFVVRVRLCILTVERGGLGTGRTLDEAKTAALADVLRSYGVGTHHEGHWVHYDPMDGPDVGELEATRELVSVPVLQSDLIQDIQNILALTSTTSISPVEPTESTFSPLSKLSKSNTNSVFPTNEADIKDIKMQKARQHIDDLVEKLKTTGKGKEAARILLSGYGETVEECRERYRSLQILFKEGQSA